MNEIVSHTGLAHFIIDNSGIAAVELLGSRRCDPVSKSRREHLNRFDERNKVVGEMVEIRTGAIVRNI